MCERDFDWSSSELICSIVFFVPDKRKSAGLTKARADMDAVAVFFFRAPFSRMVQSPPKHFN
jgi:hypothetical protein